MALWITEADVASSIDLSGAIGALERVLLSEAQGQAINMTKTHVMVGPNDALQAIGGAIAAESICGTKTWVNVAGKSQTLVILFSLVDGALRAVVEATALGQIRTAAMTGLGTKWLAPEGAREMAIVGTGKQALPQIAAVAAVRPIERVRVYSRKTENRQALVRAVQTELEGVEALASASLEAAVEGAPVVTLCTNATQPFFTAAMARRSTHINAIGAIVPTRSEFTADIFPRCTTIAVDTVEGVRELSREFIEHFGAGHDSWDRVLPLSQLIRDGYSRTADTDLTLFKAMGMGMADVAVAVEVLERCEARKLGQVLPERVRQSLPLTTARAAE